MATFGKFIYAADCKYLDPTPASSSTTIPPPPNFYHKHLLFREITISKLVIENIWRSVHGGNTERAVDLPRPRLVNVHADENVNNTNNNANYSSNSNINSTGGGGGGEETAAADMLLLHQQMTGSSIDDLRFPWDQQSKPPVVNMVLCGYRDYSLTVSLSHLLSARLLEGYAFRSIQVSQKSSSSASVGGGATATAPNPRPPKVEIILAMPWLPNVTIFYTIRTTWASFSSSSTSSPSSSSLLMNGLGGGGGSGGLVKARIELNILAHQAFAVLFVNLQKVDANAVFENALHEKVVMIHR